MNLDNLGWSDFFAHSFEQLGGQYFEPLQDVSDRIARVAVAHRNQYQLYTKAGECSAILTGKFRHRAQVAEDFPSVCDCVVFHTHPNAEHRLIDAVLPRKSQVVRQASGGGSAAAQVIAANIDTLFLVSGLDHDFNLRRIERYLAMAWRSGANPVVVLNKADLCEDVQAKQQALESVAIAVPVVVLSALHQDNLEALSPYLQPGDTVALLGSSGVGKSTLTNQLMGEVVQLTQAVRMDDSRGRHTTTHREMLRLPSGALLIDTPGMRELQLWHDDAFNDSSLGETFSDIEALQAKCRFRNCQHQSEPGCAVQAALESGALSRQRLNSYHKLQREEAYQHRRQDKQAQSNAKARWKHITKTVRQNRRREEG